MGNWLVFATGADPAHRSLTYKIYERKYQNALVLYKPLSYGKGKGNGTSRTIPPPRTIFTATTGCCTPMVR